MGKGGYHGGGTVVSPINNSDWFTGHTEDDEETIGSAKKPIELSAETESEIASLRRSIAALAGQLERTQRDSDSEKVKLRKILDRHGQPRDLCLDWKGAL
jgi:hypothetical protein